MLQIRPHRKFIHIEIRPHHNSPMLQFIHIAKFIHVANSFTLQFTHVEGRIAIRPYACIIRTLAKYYMQSITGMT